MENKNIVIVKHHPRPLNLNNPFYITQCSDIEDMRSARSCFRGQGPSSGRY